MNRITTILLTGILALSALQSGSAFAQRPPASRAVAQRTASIVASFNKSKHAVKERHGVRVEKFKEIRSEPVIKSDARDYSGSYEAPDLGSSLEIRVDANGNVVGTGSERLDADASVWRQVTLRNAKIEGALLTGTKVYENGATEPFEGVFIKKTSFDSPTDKGVTTFGLGVIRSPVSVAGVTVDKVFYQRRQ
jgi:hypothetical protein